MWNCTCTLIPHRGGWTLHDPVLAPRKVPDHVVRFCYLDAMRFPDGGYFVFHDSYEEAFGPEPEYVRSPDVAEFAILCALSRWLHGNPHFKQPLSILVARAEGTHRVWPGAGVSVRSKSAAWCCRVSVCSPFREAEVWLRRNPQSKCHSKGCTCRGRTSHWCGTFT